MFPDSVLQRTSIADYDATSGSARVGYRVIAGDVATASSRVTFTAWAVVFPEADLAMLRYMEICTLLGEVAADGMILTPLAGVQGSSFGNMSERTDLIDERAITWVSSPGGDSDDRGAVLASTGGDLVRLLATSTYKAKGSDRAVNLLEAVAERMAARENDLKLPPAGDTMSRLPILLDTYALMTNTAIEANRYTSG